MIAIGLIISVIVSGFFARSANIAVLDPNKHLHESQLDKFKTVVLAQQSGIKERKKLQEDERRKEKEI